MMELKMKNKFVEAKKQEFEIKEFVREKLGKGKISDIKIERTPVGEKIIIITAKPGLVIGRGGEIIWEISNVLKKQFKFENPQIEVSELQEPMFDAQTVADRIATSLEKFGPLKFKLVAYRELEEIKKAGALGAEIRLGGKLPSARAKSWRFAFGYLKKTGGGAKIVNKASAIASTRPGIVGVKVSIVPKNTRIPDKIEINYSLIESQSKEKACEQPKEENIEEEHNGSNKKKRNTKAK